METAGNRRLIFNNLRKAIRKTVEKMFQVLERNY